MFKFEFDEISLKIVELALKEDVANGDITTLALIKPELMGYARICAKQEMVVCGHDVSKRVLALLCDGATYSIIKEDGVQASAGDVLAEISAPYGVLLTAERTCLNFMQRLSGVATLTQQYKKKICHTPTKLLDTRKTTAGWRMLEKYAVKVGGGTNHRIGLYDAVLIKNNHIDSKAHSVGDAIVLARQFCKPGTKVEVEVRNQSELRDALFASPDAILLDNMSIKETKDSVALIRAHSADIEIESSGGITISNIAEYAEQGVDSISVGALTHSAPSVDISMKISAVA